MIRVNLYKQHDMPFQLSMASSTNIINNPMYHNKIILYKGITNKVEFSCKTQDRKTLKLEDKTLFLYVQNKEGTRKWIKELYPTDISWGEYKVVFNAEDIEDMNAGFYKGYVLAINDEGEEEVLYRGENWETEFEIEVVANQYDCYEPSKEILPDGWLYVKNPDDEYYESDWIRANNSKNHGFAFYINGYTVATIMGSNELEPTMENKSWFIIDEVELHSSEPTVINKFYQLSCEWVKIQFTDNKPIEKILYRN